MRTPHTAPAPVWCWGFLLLVLVLVGCEAQEAVQDPASDAAAPLDTPTGSLPAAPIDRDSTAAYTYEIAYPDSTRLAPRLWSALRNWTTTQKADFMSMVDDAEPPDPSAMMPWSFELDFDLVLHSDRFTSIRAKGYQYTGGAHGMPVWGTFTYDAQQDQLLTLETLLADTTALASLSDYAQEQVAAAMREASAGEALDASMRAWIEEGAAPTLTNYRLFTLTPAANERPAGLTVIFPPYQVGPYAAGTHEVFVPASVFQEGLAPAYAQAFTTAPPAE